eukprot:CAMPEP_0181290372 /NCGR_PEP_ID=MMETSP1101-20121128/1378_1 /TAXON_ID=46948 /ORGANISM="Rhodomonas abbreviata, Strain Caron Lab Isolate" /LENGTH=373 /DNA_ID=CAMNT_0023394651 /DNA_START=5 /DNA_END=1126 /DNA_ORIENTATION=+
MMRTTNTVQILEVPERKDAKYCTDLLGRSDIKVDTEEVLLAGQGLVELCSFAKLKCLGALWLNDNLLTKVEGLDTNVQIKALYLHNNLISTLRGSIKHLRHISTLTLYNNKLQDLAATLPLLEHLHHLENLDMSGNPIANEFNYRLRVIFAIPSIQVLDGHQVTQDERKTVAKLLGGSKSSTICFMKRKPIWKNPPTQPIASLSKLSKEMYREIDAAKKEREAKERERELSAFNTTKMTGTGQVPVATAVEEVTMNSKTLKDVLELSDHELGMTRTVGFEGDTALRGHTKQAHPSPQKDFVTFKRYAKSQENPEALTTIATVPASRTMSLAGSLTQSSDPNGLSVDMDNYVKYETKKRAGKTKVVLHDYTAKM